MLLTYAPPPHLFWEVVLCLFLGGEVERQRVAHVPVERRRGRGRWAGGKGGGVERRYWAVGAWESGDAHGAGGGGGVEGAAPKKRGVQLAPSLASGSNAKPPRQVARDVMG
jgi:hypothetical protein